MITSLQVKVLWIVLFRCSYCLQCCKSCCFTAVVAVDHVFSLLFLLWIMLLHCCCCCGSCCFTVVFAVGHVVSLLMLLWIMLFHCCCCLQCCQCRDNCCSTFCICGRNSVKCWYDKVRCISVSCHDRNELEH